MSEHAATPRPFGCQARPWLQPLGPDTFASALPSVMRDIARIGFAGFETALAVLPLDDPDGFARMRDDANGLVLAAAHTGGAWWEPDKAAAIPALLEGVGRLPALGCERLMLSIGKSIVDLDDHDLARMIAALRLLGESARAAGVEVAIHNHAHELADDARVIRALVRLTAPGTLAIGADLGWVANGGWDPAAFLREFGARVTYLHVRDVERRDGQDGFTEVGNGTLNWPEVVAELDEIGFAGWLVAESEFSDTWLGASDPAETATAQLRGMGRVFGSDRRPAVD